jgi:hypothetical protein
MRELLLLKKAPLYSYGDSSGFTPDSLFIRFPAAQEIGTITAQM